MKMKSIEVTANGELGSYKASEVIEALRLSKKASWEEFEKARTAGNVNSMEHFSELIDTLQDMIDWITPGD